MLKQILSLTEAMFSFLCATSSLDHAHEQSRGQISKGHFQPASRPKSCAAMQVPTHMWNRHG